jgi:hypothetical protein
MDIRKVMSLGIGTAIICPALFVYIHNNQPPTIDINDSSLLAKGCKKDETALDPSLTQSVNPILRKLAEYEAVCKGTVVDELMVFIPMPQNMSEATNLAKDTTDILKKFAAHATPPLVLFEPSITSKSQLTDIKAGHYDEILKVYFAAIKSFGVTDKEMGTWVLFPEANTPTWRTTDPNLFVANVKKVAELQKATFPESKVSLLLNSRSYPSDDSSWSHGELRSLTPYVTGMPPGLVDRLGYQGFPTASEANSAKQDKLFDAHDFLPVNLAAETAEKLGIRDVWVNTGTFSRIYANIPEEEVRISSTERYNILHSILDQTVALKARQLDISVNLFAEDKSAVSEHIDWSYWQPGKASIGPDTKNFVWFTRSIRANGVRFSLYDDAK